MHIDRLLEKCVKRNAKELQLVPGQRPRLYVADNFQETADDPLSRDDLQKLIHSITPDTNEKELVETGKTQFAFNFGNAAKFAVRIQSKGEECSMIIRVV